MEIVKNQKALRCGYTTGSCAAAASAAAARLLLTGEAPAAVRLPTPGGVTFTIEVVQARMENGAAVCAVRKDGGDDPDATHGMRIFSRVSHAEAAGVHITGGPGVGRVTKPGLAVPPGEPAINPGPRAQIAAAVQNAVKELPLQGGLTVEISAEDGETVAKKTFNARLGIVGGISILGTTGVVEPMSERALIDTIRVELDSRFAAGERDLLVCPGNYGQDFARDRLGIELSRAVTISNYIGDTLDYAVYKGFRSLLLIGHAGKLVKLAAGVMQTHSSYADGRQEVFAAHAALCGAGRETARRLMESISVDACLDILREDGLAEPVLASIAAKIAEHLEKRTRGALMTEFIVFTNASGELTRSAGAGGLLRRFQETKV